ncbi:YhdP family protein [Azonexus sp.]|uniref:YhdP family protein n=1 Tax=Azonexus sp. TaxID=1872668 RepID=UPI0039E5A905
MSALPPSLPSPQRRQLRQALNYRVQNWRRLLARSWLGVSLGLSLRLLGWLALVLWLVFVAVFLGLRFYVLPAIDDYRPALEKTLAQALGQEVRIGRISAHWRHLNPELVLEDLSLLAADGSPALTLAQVDAVFSWHSLWRWQPLLDLLVIERPVLNVRRTAEGQIEIAGMRGSAETDGSGMDWLLGHQRIRVNDATLLWDDALRAAPPLVLEDVQIRLDKHGRRHRLGVSALPPPALAGRLDVRGEFAGALEKIWPLSESALEAKFFLALPAADLAAWQPWIDYPLPLTQGQGGLRLWADLRAGKLAVTADLALDALRVQLAKNKPVLDLALARGRLSASYQAQGWQLAAREFELRTRSGVHLPPTEFSLDWQTRAGAQEGRFTAPRLDLEKLAQLSDFLPLDARTWTLLQAYAPRGEINALDSHWRWENEALTRYAVKARFSGLGVRAESYFPGAQNLRGTIEANEGGGQLHIDAKAAALFLPAVFPEAEIRFDRLQADTRWSLKEGAVAVDIERVQFDSPDAHGSAQGRYRYDGAGPGEIDLTAKIDRADGRAVWRYMPHAVNAEARQWLRDGITGGTASDAKLVLRGNLRDFPFRDPKLGQFLVTAKAHAARIDYAEGWPVIEAIDADMAFDYGMRIKAQRGRILGATLGATEVSMPDFDVLDEMLIIRGKALGPTGEFLKFIEQSPVAASIDHFTAGMQAEGAGELDLAIDLPLRRIADTRLRGRYQFFDNRLRVVDGLPPITQVRGVLDISEKAVTAKEISGQAFNGPVRVAVSSEADKAGGKVVIKASGKADLAVVGEHFAWPLLDQVSGTAQWKSDIIIQRRKAYVLVSSDLAGAVSPLPEPLHKAAGTPWPLRIERSEPVAGQENYRITLGQSLSGFLQRREGRWAGGVIAVGAPAAAPTPNALPANGLAVRIALPKIDGDAWRAALLPTKNTAATAAALPASSAAAQEELPLAQIELKTAQLKLFDNLYNALDVALTAQPEGWKIKLRAAEAEGDLLWRSAGDGWLAGRLRHLRLHHERMAAQGSAPAQGESTSLPGMQLTVDALSLDDKALGTLHLKARNSGQAWLLESLRLSNPDGELSANGRWTRGAQQGTDLDFTLNAKDIGRLLARLGYEDAVRQGTANLSGKLHWRGALTDIDYASLSGDLEVDARDGQFNQLKPGAGRLLGLISLQSLPRRLTLDFRDLFSEGFAFDRISGKLIIESGEMKTLGGLQINGPAAQVSIDGSTHLQRETQDLSVQIRPEVSMLAIGATALINPVAGAAALVANTVLKNPLNKALAYNYRITGNWSEPKVEKKGLAAITPLDGQEKTP